MVQYDASTSRRGRRYVEDRRDGSRGRSSAAGKAADDIVRSRKKKRDRKSRITPKESSRGVLGMAESTKRSVRRSSSGDRLRSRAAEPRLRSRTRGRKKKLRYVNDKGA